MSIQLPQNAELKAIVSKGFRNPTLKDLYLFNSKNPDLAPERMMNYEISFSQNILEGRLRYGANIFYIDATNMIETVVTNGMPQNQNTGTMKNWGIETEITYQLNRYITANANYSYLHTDKVITAAPRHKLYIGADYGHERWCFMGGVQWIGKLYTSTTDQEDYVLLNLRASYRALKWLKLYVKGENLLAQSYQINAGFPMPKATFMGGVDINF